MSGGPANGSFPVYYSILVSGPPGVGKLEYLLALTKAFLGAGDRVVFVALDLHPDEARGRAANIGLDLGPLEGASFAFVDCYSATASERIEPTGPRKTYTVSSYSNLEGIGMAISRAAHDLKPPVRILFYTVSTLFLHNSVQAISKFIQIITGRVKTNVGFIGYAMHEGVHEIHTTNLLRSLVDGVVEMRFTEDLSREMRFHHMRGLRVDPAWKPLRDDALAAEAGTGGAHA